MIVDVVGLYHIQNLFAILAHPIVVAIVYGPNLHTRNEIEGPIRGKGNVHSVVESLCKNGNAVGATIVVRVSEDLNSVPFRPFVIVGFEVRVGLQYENPILIIDRNPNRRHNVGIRRKLRKLKTLVLYLWTIRLVIGRTAPEKQQDNCYNREESALT